MRDLYYEYHPATLIESDKHRDEEQRFVRHQSLIETPSQTGPSPRVRLAVAMRLAMHRGQALAAPVNLPYLLPDGQAGRGILVQHNGTWALVCQMLGAELNGLGARMGTFGTWVTSQRKAS